MSKRRNSTLSVTLTDQAKAEALRTVLTFESAVRRMATGQVLAELVMRAADLDSYPDQLREPLVELENRRQREILNSITGLEALKERSARDGGRPALAAQDRSDPHISPPRRASGREGSRRP